jgi:hypothetical protein
MHWVTMTMECKSESWRWNALGDYDDGMQERVMEMEGTGDYVDGKQE